MLQSCLRDLRHGTKWDAMPPSGMNFKAIRFLPHDVSGQKCHATQPCKHSTWQAASACRALHRAQNPSTLQVAYRLCVLRAYEFQSDSCQGQSALPTPCPARPVLPHESRSCLMPIPSANSSRGCRCKTALTDIPREADSSSLASGLAQVHACDTDVCVLLHVSRLKPRNPVWDSTTSITQNCSRCVYLGRPSALHPLALYHAVVQ